MQRIKFARQDGKPFRILARGDCTSRRSIRLNSDLFPNGVELTQNEKAPFVFFLDAVMGTSAAPERLTTISDVDAMPKILRSFYLGQAERSILKSRDVDLIILDTWADLNFEIWENRQEGWKCWIHPKFLRDTPQFNANFTKLGKRSLTQSVEDAVTLIRVLKRNSPDAPVLLLNQQLEYYPKMQSRMEYYELGKMVAEQIDGVYFGGIVPKDELELDDVGSCGPGLTLHFQSGTYRKMIEQAVSVGLHSSKHLSAAMQARNESEQSHRVDKILPFLQRTISETNDESLRTPSRNVGVIEGVISQDIADHAHSLECISFHDEVRICGVKCSPFIGRTQDSLSRYVVSPQNTSGLQVAAIRMEAIDDFDSWLTNIKKFNSGNRLREWKKAASLGYHLKPFNPRTFVQDMYEIDTSKEVRSGGAMRGRYIKTIEERGGLPKTISAPVRSDCPIHWSIVFGVFLTEEGHKQGDVQVNERLVAYVSLRRTGNLVNYSQFIGHGEHLSNHIMVLAHCETIRWMVTDVEGLASGVKNVMYGAVKSGGEGLWKWKRSVGFEPLHIAIC